MMDKSERIAAVQKLLDEAHTQLAELRDEANKKHRNLVDLCIQHAFAKTDCARDLVSAAADCISIEQRQRTTAEIADIAEQEA